MKLACTQENLQRGLNIVGRTVSRSSTLPVLGNVLLKTDTGGLRLTATDLELGVSCLVGGKVDEKGELTVPARLLADYVGQLPKEKVSLTAAGKALEVQCEERHAQINGINAEEFPLIPKVEATFTAVLPAGALRDAIQKVAFAVATDESRPELSGVYLQLENGRCTLAATDSFRLAEASFKAPGVTTSRTAIVPAKTLSELARIIDQDDAEVQLHASDNQVLLTYHDVELTSRLIEGQYPPYKDIIPADLPTRATLDRGEFLEAVRAAGLFSKTGASDVRLAVDASGKISLKAQASQVGGHEQVLAASVDGPTDEVVFNYRYLLEGLAALEGNRVAFSTGGSSSPGKLVDPKDPDFLYILMPIKL